jgi:hypothetical protein
MRIAKKTSSCIVPLLCTGFEGKGELNQKAKLLVILVLCRLFSCSFARK